MLKNKNISLSLDDRILLVPFFWSLLEILIFLKINILSYCYTYFLNPSGNCRICLIEIEKTNKPQPSCIWQSNQLKNMKIYTYNPKILKSQENILEFFLANHPLDCPICDQGNECDLQNYTIIKGKYTSRYYKQYKRSFETKFLFIFIKTIFTRCIHCTKCVRFFKESLNNNILGAFGRSNKLEIGTYFLKNNKTNIATDLVGNIIDLCPVGALTDKNYAFTLRPWDLEYLETFDCFDSLGSEIFINFKESFIVRILPRWSLNNTKMFITDRCRLLGLYFYLNKINIKKKWFSFLF